ncbi:MAG: hypothetical protein LBR36_00150 [Bacteroidales bacterium]|jgi:hypothetical protein|nr:hypothetical protein [Bacteroidales bacterium]
MEEITEIENKLNLLKSDLQEDDNKTRKENCRYRTLVKRVQYPLRNN